jgi:hypothetical protein
MFEGPSLFDKYAHGGSIFDTPPSYGGSMFASAPSYSPAPMAPSYSPAPASPHLSSSMMGAGMGMMMGGMMMNTMMPQQTPAPAQSMMNQPALGDKYAKNSGAATEVKVKVESPPPPSSVFQANNACANPNGLGFTGSCSKGVYGIDFDEEDTLDRKQRNSGKGVYDKDIEAKTKKMSDKIREVVKEMTDNEISQAIEYLYAVSGKSQKDALKLEILEEEYEKRLEL